MRRSPRHHGCEHCGRLWSHHRASDSACPEGEGFHATQVFRKATRLAHIRATKIDVFDESRYWEAPLCQGLPGDRKTKKPRYAEQVRDATCPACWRALSNGVPINHQAKRLGRKLRLVE